MKPFRCMVTVGHKARVIVWNCRLTERKETVKQRSESDIQRDPSHWHRAWSNPLPGCLWRLCWSTSTPTELFRPNRIFFCWWGSMSLSSSHIKAAYTLIIHRNDHIAFELPDLQDQKSLTLRWHSISDWGRERVARSFAYGAGQYRISEWSQPIAIQITNDPRPTILDALLTLILPWAYPPYDII